MIKNSYSDIDPLSKYQKICIDAMSLAASKLGILNIPPMEVPPTSELGDFSYPCFALSRELAKPPQQIAEILKNEMGDINHIETFAVNGYLNFKIDYNTLISETLPVILKDRNEFGRFPSKDKKIILEHTSANPNGPFHVGRARNPIIGDTLARILRRAGYPVEVQYWVNDMGKQVAILSWGVSRFEESDLEPVTSSKPDHKYVRYYQKAYSTMEEQDGVEQEIQKMIQAYERGDKDELRKVREPCENVLQGMIESLNRLNIFIDRFVWESEGVIDGTVDKIIEKLKKSDISMDENGSLYLDLDKFDIGGKSSRFVYTRSDGTSLYTTRDLAYHQKKLQECDIAINILGEDHKLQSRQLEIALNILGTKIVPEVVFYSFVSLEEGKMSTRRGKVVYLDDLMDEAKTRAMGEVESRRPELSEEQKEHISEDVGLGAIRFNIIRVQPEKKIVFRWKDALNFEGNSAPFVQYSHARACSILRKARAEMENINKIPENVTLTDCAELNTDILSDPSEEALMRALAKLPSLVIDCAENRKTHPVAAYALNIAALFNQFYKNCPVLTAETGDLKRSRLALVEASRWCLAISLEMLGINAPEMM